MGELEDEPILFDRQFVEVLEYCSESLVEPLVMVGTANTVGEEIRTE